MSICLLKMHGIRFLQYKGFKVCDEADNGIQLWYLPFAADAPLTEFKECARHPHIKEKGYVLYYTSQCPSPVTTYALFYDGAYLTNEQMNDRKFLKLLSR